MNWAQLAYIEQIKLFLKRYLSFGFPAGQTGFFAKPGQAIGASVIFLFSLVLFHDPALTIVQRIS